MNRTVIKPRQPSKLDAHPLIPSGEYEGRMREALGIALEEVKRREAEYQEQQAEKRKQRTTIQNT